jgi:hypothetical protein
VVSEDLEQLPVIVDEILQDGPLCCVLVDRRRIDAEVELVAAAQLAVAPDLIAEVGLIDRSLLDHITTRERDGLEAKREHRQVLAVEFNVDHGAISSPDYTITNAPCVSIYPA